MWELQCFHAWIQVLHSPKKDGKRMWQRAANAVSDMNFHVISSSVFCEPRTSAQPNSPKQRLHRRFTWGTWKWEQINLKIVTRTKRETLSRCLWRLAIIPLANQSSPQFPEPTKQTPGLSTTLNISSKEKLPRLQSCLIYKIKYHQICLT